jgi:acyl-CoA dehydrogenase
VSDRLTPRERAFQACVRAELVPVLQRLSEAADTHASTPEQFGNEPAVRAFSLANVPTDLGGGWRPRDAPSECFCFGESPLLQVLAAEQCGYVDGALFASMPGPSLSGPAVEAMASPDLRAWYFRHFMSESPVWTAFALTEPGGGNDAAALRTTAIADHDGYLISGRKLFIGNGTRAAIVLVFATLRPALKSCGLGAFLFDAETLTSVRRTRMPLSAFRALSVTEMVFDAQRIAGTRRADGRAGGAFTGMVATLNRFRPVLAGLAAGAAAATLDELNELVRQNGSRHASARAWGHARERIEAWRCRVRAATLLGRRAAEVRCAPAQPNPLAAVAKTYAAAVVRDVTSEGRRLAAICGHIDQRWERRYRDARAFDLMEGSGDVHRLSVGRAECSSNLSTLDLA